jgi:hypothetical protein
MENEPLSREQIDAEVKRLDRKIAVLMKIEPTPDWHVAMKHYTEQRELLVSYLKRIDSTDT